MNKFKPGDRIKIYAGRDTLIGTIETVIGDKIRILHTMSFYHYKCCRKLVKKGGKSHERLPESY